MRARLGPAGSGAARPARSLTLVTLTLSLEELYYPKPIDAPRKLSSISTLALLACFFFGSMVDEYEDLLLLSVLLVWLVWLL